MKFIGNDASSGKYVDPPTSISATAGNAQATISFTLPTYDGKGVATYVATSSPGGLTGSGSSSPITVTGLTNGTAYTFTVTTLSGYGVSAVSVASNSATPVAPPYFPPSFPPEFDPCAGVACGGSCGNTAGYTYGGEVFEAGNPFGNCPGCEGVVYDLYTRTCCVSLACFKYCSECGAAPPPSFGPSFGPSFPPSFPPYFSNT
jgi:hypothetical protein